MRRGAWIALALLLGCAPAPIPPPIPIENEAAESGNGPEPDSAAAATAPATAPEVAPTADPVDEPAAPAATASATAATPDPAPAPSQTARPVERRAVWITRWDYRTEADVRAAIRNVRALRCDTVFFQVRGAADAFYRGAREPWGEDIGGRDPGFDPLAVACEEGAAQGVAIHAYLNVMPVWKGTTAPRDRTHLWHTHREWLAVGKDAKPPALNEHYVVLNPAHPEARAHVVALFRDVAARYPVAGIHMDYVRYLSPEHSYDATTLARYREETGKRPGDDAGAWATWRRAQVATWVRAIAEACRAARPGIEISAAVWRTPASGREKVLQDYPAWVEAGGCDFVCPMIYTKDGATFGADLRAVLREVPAERVVAGIGVYLGDDEKIPVETAASLAPDQIAEGRAAGIAGFGLFAYGSFHATADTDGGYQGKDAARLVRLRTARRAALVAGPLSDAGGR